MLQAKRLLLHYRCKCSFWWQPWIMDMMRGKLKKCILSWLSLLGGGGWKLLDVHLLKRVKKKNSLLTSQKLSNLIVIHSNNDEYSHVGRIILTVVMKKAACMYTIYLTHHPWRKIKFDDYYDNNDAKALNLEFWQFISCSWQRIYSDNSESLFLWRLQILFQNLGTFCCVSYLPRQISIKGCF